MNKNFLQEVSEQTLKLEKVLSTATPGEYFTYKQLQELSGVTMNEKGKQYMRSAFSRLKLDYEVRPGEGVTVLSPDNAMRIIAHRVIKIDNSVKKAEKVTKQVQKRVYNELSDVDKKQINVLAGFFGTIRTWSNSAKKLMFSKEPVQINQITK